MRQYKNKKAQLGASMIETMLVFPVMFLMAMGIVHLGLVYQAKSNLEYAALMAARIGSVTSVNIGRMRQEVADRMKPSQIGSTAMTTADVRIDILNPTTRMFSDCGQAPSDNSCTGNCELPNFGLQFRSTASVCDGASIQDANLLRIKVSVRFDSKIPFMNMRLFPGDSHNITPGSDQNPSGINISAIATVRMQTPARMTSLNQAYYL